MAEGQDGCRATRQLLQAGQHLAPVIQVYADRFTPKDEQRRSREAGEEARSIAVLKRFTVFNAAQ